MSDTAQTRLREPDPVNWDQYASGSKYQAPPDVLGPDGKFIQFYVKVKPKFDESKDFSATQEGFRSYQVGPLTVTKSGSADGYDIKFKYVNVKKRERNGKVVDSSSAGDFIRAAGITAKPQKNAEYDAAVRQTVGRVLPCTLDWEARNKDNEEEIHGVRAFPIDPTTGKRKAILKAGDIYNVLDAKGMPTGETKTVKSEVLFANAVIKYFKDPNRG